MLFHFGLKSQWINMKLRVNDRSTVPAKNGNRLQRFRHYHTLNIVPLEFLGTKTEVSMQGNT